MANTYYYRICLGRATLIKNMDDSKFIKIGNGKQYKNDQEAKDACMKHFSKACRALENLGREIPSIAFM